MPRRSGKSVSFAVTLSLLVGLMAVLFVPAVRRLFPPVTDLAPSGDDWWTYHRYALSVLQDGLSMPAVHGAYTRPGGFGYVYFVAGCYAIFGVRSQVVYVLQALLLAGAVVGFVVAFRRRLRPFAMLVYGVLLVVFADFDTFRFYTFRLLSENLLIVLLASLFIAIERLWTSRAWPWAVTAGLLCGACFLARPNTVLLAPAWALLLIWQKRDRRAVLQALALLGGLAVMASLLVWRDYAATGSLDLRVLTTTQDWPQPSVAMYARRILYVLGDLHALIPEYGLWWRWLVAWACVVLLLIRIVRTNDFDRAALVFVAAYYGPLIAVGDIANYGIRMLMPAMPVVLFLAIRGVAVNLSAQPDTTVRPLIHSPRRA